MHSLTDAMDKMLPKCSELTFPKRLVELGPETYEETDHEVQSHPGAISDDLPEQDD